MQSVWVGYTRRMAGSTVRKGSDPAGGALSCARAGVAHLQSRKSQIISGGGGFPSLVVCILSSRLVQFTPLMSGGHAVACIHPLTFHANLCFKRACCVYNGEHTDTHARGVEADLGGGWGGVCECI